MKVMVLDAKKDKPNGHYNKIILQFEDGRYHTVHSTNELSTFMSTHKDLEPVNFKTNPFIVFSNNSNNTKTNNSDLVKIYDKLKTLINKVDVVDKKQSSLRKDLLAISSPQLPSTIDTSNIEERLSNIDSNVSNILSKLGLLDQSIAERADKITEDILRSNGNLHDKLIEIVNKVDPVFCFVQKKVSEERCKPFDYKYPKCGSDRNTWRYNGLPDKALRFSLDSETGDIFGEDAEEEAKLAFGQINNPESLLDIEFDKVLIIALRSWLEKYDSCRKYSEIMFHEDLGNKKELSIEEDDAAYYAACSSFVNQTTNLGLRHIENTIKNALTNDKATKDIGQAIVVGTAGSTLSIALLLGYLGINMTRTTADMLGFKGERIARRAYKTNGNENIRTSVNSRYGEDVKNILTTDIIHDTDEDKENYLNGNVVDIDTLFNAMLYDCRIFTVDKLSALTKKPAGFNKVHRVKEVEKINKYISHTNAKNMSEDMRLFLVYLRYYQQAFFGYNLKEDGFTKCSYVVGSEQESKKALFDCLQNAYFTSKHMLIIEPEGDGTNPDSLPLREERIDWLNSIDRVSDIDYDIIKCLKFMLKNMKLCLCIQGISPICADKLLQMFCNHGNISYRVTTNSREDLRI